MPKKKKIAIFTTSQGHLSIAEAVAKKIQYLASNEFEIIQFFSNSVLMKEYGMVYKFAPFAFGVPYALGKYQRAKDVASSYLYRKLSPEVGDFIEKERPDLCINTNFVFLPVLEKICKKKKAPFLNVLANPGLAHPLEIASMPNHNLVLDNSTRRLLQKNYPDEKFSTTGWFVRSVFEKKYSKLKIRKKHKISPDTFHALIASGSEGTSAITKFLPSLLRVNKPAIITVACGKSKILAKQVRVLAKILKKISPNIEIRIFGFTKEIYEHMQSADIVVGKAGPNTLFESIATQTPFFAITHVVGQEDVNLKIIRDHNLGFVEENPLKAGRILEKIISDPSLLNKFKSSVEKMAQHNSESGQRLVKIIRQFI